MSAAYEGRNIEGPAPSRSRSLAAAGALVFFIGYAAVQAYFAFAWTREPFPGFLVHRNLIVGPDNAPSWPGRPAVRYYDWVLEAEGQPLATSLDLYRFVHDWTASRGNTPIRYLVDRWGEQVSVSVPPWSFGKRDLWVAMIPVFIVGSICLLSAILILYMRPATHPSSMAFILALLLVGLWFVTVFDYQTYQIFLPVMLLVLPLVPAPLFHLSLTFPHPWGFVERRPWLVWLPYAIFGVQALVNFGLFYLRPDLWRYFDYASTVQILLGVLIFVGSTSAGAALAREPLDRLRAKTILLGSVVAFLLPVSLALFSSIPYYMLALFMAAFPISVAYCMVRHNLFHIDVIIRRGVEYGVLTFLTASIYLALVYSISQAFSIVWPVPQTVELFYITFTLLFALAFNRVRGNVQSIIDRLFFRSKYDYRATIRSLCNSLSSVMGLEEVLAHITRELAQAMHLESVHILLRDEAGKVFREVGNRGAGEGSCSFAANHLLPRLLESRQRPVFHSEVLRFDVTASERLHCLEDFESLGARIAVPLMLRHQLTGILALGKKKNGLPFNSEDVELLQAVAAAGAVAIENAQTLERIRQTSHELNSLRKLGVAMGSVKSLDALLEMTLHTLCDDMEFPSAAILLLTSPDGSTPVDCWVLHGTQQAHPERCRLELQEIPGEMARLLFPGTTSKNKRRGHAVRAPLFRAFLEAAERRVLLPLGSDDAPIGLIALTPNPRSEALNDSQSQVLDTLVEGVASAIRYTQLHDLLEGITNHSPSAIAVIDELDRIVFENGAFAEMFPGNSNGSNDCDIFSRLALSPSSQRELMEQVTKVRQGSVVNPEICAEGSRYFRYYFFTFGEQGKLHDHIGLVIQDVTEEYRIRDQLLHSEKVAAVGQVISGIAHELNNPLAGVIGYIDLILASGLNDSSMKYLDKANESAQRCKKIVQNLVNFVRKAETRKELTDCNQLVQKTVDLLSYQMQVEDIRVELDFAAGLPNTMLDTSQIQQVLLNLINNAFYSMKQASRGSGHVLTLRTEHDAAFGMVRILVSDTGLGIPRAHLEKIFEPFFTTKPAGEGTGLGLSLSYGIVRSHNGFLDVDSIEGQGTTFTITLPILKCAERLELPVDQAMERTAPARILVVDDEEVLRDMVQRMLEREGHTVVKAGDGQDALDLYLSEHFDVVLTDVKMPRMDGITFYERAVAVRPELARQCIIVTGDTITKETDHFLTRTALPLIHKPFSKTILLQTIRKVQMAGMSLEVRRPESDHKQDGIRISRTLVRNGVLAEGKDSQ